MSEDPTREDHTGEDHTRGHGFDELARSVAEGSLSRRRALKLFAGTAIAALIPSRAMAAVTCPPGTVKVCDVPRRADGDLSPRRSCNTLRHPGTGGHGSRTTLAAAVADAVGPTNVVIRPPLQR